MSAFTYITPDASIIIEHRADGGKVLQVRGGSVALSMDAIKLLAYHCALYYRDATHLEPFAPANIIIDLPSLVRLPNIL